MTGPRLTAEPRPPEPDVPNPPLTASADGNHPLTAATYPAEPDVPDPPASASVTAISPCLRPPGPRLVAEARWALDADGPPPAVAGFVLSEFSPAVAEAAERCLRRHFGEPPAQGGEGVAVVLVSVEGDTGTARTVAATLDAGRRVPPLLFFQSNPNAVLGHVSARWNLGGPVVALGPGHEDPREEAALLLDDGDADLVLVLTARPHLVTAGLYAPPKHVVPAATRGP